MKVIGRAKSLLISPAREWPVIEAEQASIRSLFREYAVWLAAVPAVASFIGVAVIGQTMLFARIRISVGSAIRWSVVNFVLSLATAYCLGLLIDVLAPKFEGTSSAVQAQKLAVYSFTAAWVAGAFAVVPELERFRILGLYTLYLLYAGAPRLMRVPERKVMGFVITLLFSAAALFVVARVVGDQLAGTG